MLTVFCTTRSRRTLRRSRSRAATTWTRSTRNTAVMMMMTGSASIVSLTTHQERERETGERDGEVLSPVLCPLVYRSWQGEQLAGQTTALSGSCPAVRAWRLRTVQFAMLHPSLECTFCDRAGSSPHPRTRGKSAHPDLLLSVSLFTPS
eukprot:scpid70910/ scgid32719/ 